MEYYTAFRGKGVDTWSNIDHSWKDSVKWEKYKPEWNIQNVTIYVGENCMYFKQIYILRVHI